MADTWWKFFGIDRVGIRDDFFELGGGSLKAMSLLAIIHKEVDVAIPLAEIFNRPVIEALAEFINSARKTVHVSIKPVEEKEYYELSSAQKRLFFLDQLEDIGTSYNMPFALNCKGHLDKHRLDYAVNALLERHTVLRTSFLTIDDLPFQRIHPHVEFRLQEIGAEKKDIREIIDQFIQPFDLSRAPLWRVALYTISDQENLLLFDVHHIIGDGTTISILVEEFARLYAGEALPPLKIQYKDFSARQNHESESRRLKKQEDYWLNRYSGEIPRLNLPTDYPRPPVFNFEGEIYEYAPGIEDIEGYRETASRGGTTLYMNMLTFFMVLLYKYTGREDIIVGTGIAGRPHDDLQNVGGLFVNLLPMRAQPHGTKTFPEFLTEIKDISLRAFENQEVQFEDLVNKLNLDRDISGNPLFDVSFGVQNFRRSKFKVKEITFTPYEFEMKTSKFDISFLVHEEKDKIFFRFEYCTRLFKGETIRRMANHLGTIIRQVNQHPGIRLSDIDILTHREKRLLLVDFNKTTADFPFHKSIHGLFEDRVAKTPDLTAVEDETGCFTYRQLDRAANQLAHDLISRGHILPGHDHCVGILMENCRSLATALWGTLKAGAAYVPISPGWPEERTRRVIADAGIRVVISRGNQPDMDISIARDGGLPETLKYPPNLDGPGNHPHPPDIPGGASHNLAYVIYTSGTTGIPNGILIRHDSVVNYTSWKINLCGFTSSDVILQMISPSFDGFGSNFFPTLLTGGKLVMVETQKSLDSHYIGGLIKDKKITGFSAAPPIYRALLEGAEENQLRGLRFVVLGGEKPGDDLIEKSNRLIPRLTLINEYGPTETTIAAAAHFGPAPGEASVIGKPIANTSIFILDKDKKPVPIGVTGELYISGSGLARGYLNRPELTAEKFSRGAAPLTPLTPLPPYPPTPWLYRTGDLARWLPEGNIEFLGRIDHQVKLRGYRIELSEIENRLSEYDKITDAVIVAGKAAGTNDNGNDIRYLAAYYVSRQETSPDVSEIREFLSKRLPGYMVPSYFIQLEKLPLTPQGKVDRKSLPSPLTAAAGQEYIPAGSEIEKDLVKMWAEVLEIEEGNVGINDNFFDLGGHSLKATGLVSRIRKEMDTRFPLNMVFKEPTIKGFAGYISKARRAIYEEITPVEKREYYPQSYAQKRIFLLERSENTGTAYNNVTVLKVEGQLDKKSMANAFNRLLRRHEALRTSFDLMNGEPVQKVHEADRIEFEIEDLEWKRADGVDAAVKDFVRPFDLSCSPLLRVGLIQIDQKTHILVVDMHQITSDGVSKGILVNEFSKLYSGEELPPLRLQYKDFTLWQNGLLQTGKIKEQEDFWLGLYPAVDSIPRLNLPADHPRPSKKTFEGATYGFKLGFEDARRFKEMGSARGVTLFMNLLAALNVLLYRYTGMNDIILGCGIMGRPYEELENIIGLFVNLLPLRNSFDPEMTYDEFLGKVKETCIRAFECQDVQLEALVEKLKLEREPSRDNPFFDMAFLLQNFDRSVVHLENVSFSLCENKHHISKFDITLFTFEVGDEIHFTTEYSTRLFKRETIERMTTQYTEIIRQAVRNSRLRIKNFELPGDSMREKVT